MQEFACDCTLIPSFQAICYATPPSGWLDDEDVSRHWPLLHHEPTDIPRFHLSRVYNRVLHQNHATTFAASSILSGHGANLYSRYSPTLLGGSAKQRDVGLSWSRPRTARNYDLLRL